MFKNTPFARTQRCAFLALVAFGNVVSAQAQEDTDFDRMLDVAEAQTMVTQRMSAEALLVALGIDLALSLEHLDASRNDFDRALTGFRDGDPTLQMSAIVDPELLEYIDEAERHWVPMEAAVGDCLSGVPITAAHVAAIADASESLQDVLEDLTDGLRERSKTRGSYSMLGVALETARGATLLSQQMTKEFLLVAFGHQASRNRSALRQTAEKFQDNLQGLVEGDIDRLLLAAPTPGIRAQLLIVQQIWDAEYRPLIERAVTEGDLNAGAVARMARVNLSLLHEIQLVATMYHELY